jgi:hypothetical protein
MAEMIRVSQPSPKPAVIDKATFLLWLSLGVGGLKTALDWPHLQAMSRSTTFLVCTMVFTFAVLALLYWNVGQGRNWARITLLVLFIIGVVPALLILRSDFQRSAVIAILGAIQTLFQIYALWLVFTVPGRNWFTSRRA